LDSIIGIVAKIIDGESEDLNSGREDFSMPKGPDWPCGPPSLLFSRYWGAFPGLK